MGIAGLWNILSQMSKGLNRADYLNKKTVSVDISGLLYSYYYTSSDEERKNYHVRATFLIITRILSLGLMPVFVFDSGAPHWLKTEELERRRSAEASLIRSTKGEADAIDADEYRRLETEALDDIMAHFSASHEQNTLQEVTSKTVSDSFVPEHWSDSSRGAVTSFMRCTACPEITPINFDQPEPSSTASHFAGINAASEEKEEEDPHVSDSLEFRADYNYEGTKHLLSHKLHFNSDAVSVQLEEYASWQLHRRLAVSQMNEQVFTAIRQQRDAARLALLTAMSPHRSVKQTPTSKADVSPMQRSIFSASRDAEEYFSTLPYSISDRDPSTTEASHPAPSFVAPSSPPGPGWREELSGSPAAQEMDASATWNRSTNNQSYMKKLMNSSTAVGTTFSSFVNQSTEFPEVGVFKVGVYKMHKRLAGNTDSSSVYKPLTERVIAEVLQIANLFKVPCIKCKPGYEAEHVCALLNSHGYVAAVLTEDSDVIAYRPVLVLRLFGRLSSIHDVSGFQSIRQRDISLYFSSDDIIFLALIMGCDFCDGIPSFGYVHTLELLLYLKYFAPLDDPAHEFHTVSIHKLIDRFRLYLSFNGLVVHPGTAASQVKNHEEFILHAHEIAVKQNWDKIVAYNGQACFPTYFPTDHQAHTFLRELVQLRPVLNRRLWFRRELLLRKLQQRASPGSSSNGLLKSMFAKLTSRWDAVIKLFSQHVPVEEACVPISMGGRTVESLIQRVNVFSQQHIAEQLDMLTEGSDGYRPRIGEELQRLLRLPALSIQACLQRTRTSFVKNREDINRVQITELLSTAIRRGNIFSFQSLGKRAFQALRALFVLKTIYS